MSDTMGMIIAFFVLGVIVLAERLNVVKRYQAAYKRDPLGMFVLGAAIGMVIWSLFTWQ